MKPTTVERPLGLVLHGIETILNPYTVLIKGIAKGMNAFPVSFRLG
ncbi:MAG: hypothetical protein HZA07_05150 [Nitrospirae bacterium]|nr:hypothetical protein [Nitrospirota bacterium]